MGTVGIVAMETDSDLRFSLEVELVWKCLCRPLIRLLSPGTLNNPSSLRARGCARYSTHTDIRYRLIPMFIVEWEWDPGSVGAWH